MLIDVMVIDLKHLSPRLYTKTLFVFNRFVAFSERKKKKKFFGVSSLS